MYSVMWSEHCSYKSSKVHLRYFGETTTEEMRAGDAGRHRRERRRRRHRRRLGGDLQGGIAQPPVLRRAVPGCRDRRRRHRPRHHGDGRPSGRGDGPAALRRRRRARHPPRARRCGARDRRLRQLAGPAQHRRRDRVRRLLRRQSAGERAVRRGAAQRGSAPGVRVGHRQQDHPVRRPHRPGRHRRGVGAGIGDVRRRRRRRRPQEAAVGAGGRPVHGEGAHRVLPGAVRRGPGDRHPGSRRGRVVLRHIGTRIRRRRRHDGSSWTRCRCARPI